MSRGYTGINAFERIVVQVTSQEKQAIADKARRLNMTVSELMRRGEIEYAPVEADIVELAKVVQASAERSIAMIDETTRCVAQSNARIEATEAKAKAVREKLRAQRAGGVCS